MQGTASRPPAVVVDGVSKRFRLPQDRAFTLKERALHPLRKTSYSALEALTDVSFTVAQGEFFGIVGRNGSGKSTLLKCLAGIYGTDEGTISVAGRMSTFIELGVGFNPDLAAYDNVITNAVMLGLSPSEAAARFEHVIAFAELEEYVDLKIRNYSSGMLVRLAFSVAIEAHADVLLIDEVLAVGDAAFQQKCFDVFQRMREEGRTMLLVTHDMGMVERFCDRAMVLERGRAVVIDEPDAAARRYLELNFESDPRTRVQVGSSAFGDGTAVIESVAVEHDDGRAAESVNAGEHAAVRLRVRFNEDTTDPVFSVTFVNEAKLNVFVASNLYDEAPGRRFSDGEVADVRIRFENHLGPGRYDLSAVVTRPGLGFDIMHRVERAASFVATNATPTGGVVDLPHDVTVESATARVRTTDSA